MRKRTLRIPDEKWIEGLPLKLVIIVIILTIMLPIIWTGLNNYDCATTENYLRSQIDYLITKIKQVYLNGAGNAATLELNFKEGLFGKVSWVKIGDSPAWTWSAVMYKMNFKAEDTVVIENPNIPVTNFTGGPHSLELGPGRYTVHLVCKYDSFFPGKMDLFVDVGT